MRPTWCRLLFAVLFASLLPRCIVLPANTVEAPLEDVVGPGLEVRLVLSGQGRLRLTYDSLKEKYGCLRYTGGKVRLNGVELEQTEEGFGIVVIGPIGGGQICTDPEWAFTQPPPTEEVSEFEITDSTGQLLYGISALMAKRSVAVQPGRPAIVSGGPLTLAWSPATDQLEVNRVTIDGLSSPVAPVARNGRIGLLVPTDVLTGTHEVSVSASLIPGTAHCEPDPDRCKFLFRQDELLSTLVSVQ